MNQYGSSAPDKPVKTANRGRLVVLILALWLAAICFAIIVIPVGHPAAVVPPVRAVVPDTGWHMAQDAHEHVYQIDLPYTDMDDSQQDDANRFGRLYPEGQ